MNAFDPFAFKHSELSDGTPLYTNLSFPVRAVLLGVFFPAGSRDEEPGKEGLAHFMEHMPFRGTARFPDKRSLALPIESRGGIINAWTADDSIVFLAKVAPEDAELGAEVLQELTLNAKLEARDFEEEREVVLQEYFDHYAEAGAYAEKTAYSLLFKNHSLGHRPMGEPSSLKSLLVSDVRNFYERHCRYGPRVIFVLGGGTDEERLADLAFRFFSGSGNVVKIPRKQRKQEVLAEIAGEERVVVTDRPYARTAIFIAVRGFPGNDLRSEAATGIFFAMLGGGFASPLFTALREREGLVYGYDTGYDGFNETGVLWFKAGAEFTNTQRVCEKFWETVSDVASDRQRFQVAKEMVRKAEGMKEYTLWHALFKATGDMAVGSPILSLQEERSLIEAVEYEDVRRLAETYFRKDRSVTVIVKGQA